LEKTAHRRNRRLARLDLERWRVSRSGREEDEAAEEARVLGALGAARGWAEGVGADEATAADVAGVAVKTSRQNPLPEKTKLRQHTPFLQAEAIAAASLSTDDNKNPVVSFPWFQAWS
jgi:hypothetical protein